MWNDSRMIILLVLQLILEYRSKTSDVLEHVLLHDLNP